MCMSSNVLSYILWSATPEYNPDAANFHSGSQGNWLKYKDGYFQIQIPSAIAVHTI